MRRRLGGEERYFCLFVDENETHEEEAENSEYEKEIN